MQNIVWKILVIIGVLGVCGLLMYPPQEKIRLGNDLRGGVSLTYAVRMEEDRGVDRQAVLRQTISVLKDRVNPQGTLDIQMNPLGDRRIEIVMPLPSPEVQALRRAYEDQLDTLLDRAEIDPVALDEALRYGRAPEAFGGSATERGKLIVDLQQAYDTMQAARTALSEARERGADDEEVFPLEDAVAEAEILYEDQYRSVLNLSLERSQIVRALSLSPTRKVARDPDTGKDLRDPDTGEKILEPSQREVALDNLRQDYPHLVELVDATVAAHDAFQARRTGFDDPGDLMRLLRGAGVLEFRISVADGAAQGVNVDDMRRQLMEVGPDNTDSTVARWFPINDLKQWYDGPEQLAALEVDPITYFANIFGLVAAERDDIHYLLLYTTPDKSLTHTQRQWAIEKTYQTVDGLGRPAVAFGLDASGGALMARLTGANINEPMAIVLDGQVYSAPNINSQIGSNGIIQGNFSQSELNYLIRVLAAGALEARLSEEPIAVNTLGPTVGQDNFRRGMEAFAIAIVAVAVFMVLYYFFAGLVADFALIANGVIIFGVMAGIDGTFTLPGLAGIVLTMGMAVDANVLIYERIREELFTGEVDLRGAVRLGYAKALSTILDGNITNLIVCAVLYKTATTEVKGFALTLSIGICATLFTALFVTRAIYTLYTDFFRLRTLPMLATVVPAIHRTLEPNINWMGLRRLFWVLSCLAVTGSLVLVGKRGVDMFDTELRGGVAVTMATAAGDDGEPLYLPHIIDRDGQLSVETRIRRLGEQSSPEGASGDEEGRKRQVLREFRNANVLTVGSTVIRDGAIFANRFQVKVANPKGMDDDETIADTIVDAIVEEFGDLLDVTKPVTFTGANAENPAPYLFPIEDAEIGKNIGEPSLTTRAPRLLGGVAIKLTDIEPPITLDDAAGRIDRMRQQPDFIDTASRDEIEVYGITPVDANDPSQGYRDIVVAVFDSRLSFIKVDSDLWFERLAQREWQLVSTALQRRTSLEQVSSYSSAVAESLQAAATVAVVLSLLGILFYIWVRFGSLRYSLAAIVALVHDVSIALGLLAATAFISRTTLGQALLVEEFRIDLGVVAALLTIIGYSLNDTIVILDRIRENRGKLPIPTVAIVNRSINQTISRTLLTSVTTLIAVLIMYIEGGSGIRSFTFCLLAGLVVGTYSSVAIAAPMVIRHGKGPSPESAGDLTRPEDAAVTV